MPKKRAKKEGKPYEMPPPMPVGEVMTDIMKKQWSLGESIGKGGFGEIYLASPCRKEAPSAKAEYVIKIEPYENGPLFTELAFYRRGLLENKIKDWIAKNSLDYLAVPTFITSGLHDFSDKKYRFMVMQRFGKDLGKYFKEAGGTFCEDTVCYLALRLLEALEYLHENCYVHADIKSSNLLTGFGKGQEHRVYLVDYGLAHLYTVQGEHRPYKEDPRCMHDGTLEFTSIDAHNGVDPARRGDLEILGYCLLQWASGKLPWEEEKDKSKVARMKKEYHGKASMLVKDCFQSSGPKYLVDYMNHVYKLDYNEKPSYEYLKNLFSNHLKGCDPTKNLEWRLSTRISRKRKSEEGLPVAKKKRRVKEQKKEVDVILPKVVYPEELGYGKPPHKVATKKGVLANGISSNSNMFVRRSQRNVGKSAPKYADHSWTEDN